jgi:hypothetical protein
VINDFLSYIYPEKTCVAPSIERAMLACSKQELLQLANALLDSWRIVQNECEEKLYSLQDRSAEELQNKDIYSLDDRNAKELHNTVSEYQKLMVLGIKILRDFAKTCYECYEEYRYTTEGVDEDKVGQCKLNVLVPRPPPAGEVESQSTWVSNTTVETLEFEDHIWEKGSGITHVVQTIDALGRLLDKAEHFGHAGLLVAQVCRIRVQAFYNEIGAANTSPELILEALSTIINSGLRERAQGWPERKKHFKGHRDPWKINTHTASTGRPFGSSSTVPGLEKHSWGINSNTGSTGRLFGSSSSQDKEQIAFK